MDIWLEDNTDLEADKNSCPICHGAQFVHPVDSDGKPDYRKVVPCKCVAAELENKRNLRLQKYSNLGNLTRFTFQNLSPEGRKGANKRFFNFKKIYDAAVAFAEHPAGWFILVGPNGCGKTHLACAIANYQIQKASQVFYFQTADLIDYLRAAYDEESDITHGELFEQIKNTTLLILDDLSLALRTPWSKEKIQQLLNYRFNKQLPTVITSNIEIERLETMLQAHLTDPDFCNIYIIEEIGGEVFENFGGLEMDLIRKMTFDSFNYKRVNLTLEQRQNLEQAYQIARNFAQSPQGWLVFLGENGCGKTHLAAAIANHINQQGMPVLFIVVPDFLDYLRSTFNPDRHISYDSLFEKVKKVPVLVLDDFGEQADTRWARDKLYQLINYRYNSRLPTVITSSYALDEIENRIASRLVDPSLSLVFYIIVPDYRGDRKALELNKKQRNKKTS